MKYDYEYVASCGQVKDEWLCQHHVLVPGTYVIMLETQIYDNEAKQANYEEFGRFVESASKIVNFTMISVCKNTPVPFRRLHTMNRQRFINRTLSSCVQKYGKLLKLKDSNVLKNNGEIEYDIEDVS